ncbi:hypothetical protein ABZT02_24270 [Streptomyces sp. NPDC005402]|uniref:hypothetical protein n=1 Tax=Streptomyces sp. NPDC005402 TaxID=3155338 RepID=UPI0033B5EDFC
MTTPDDTGGFGAGGPLPLLPERCERGLAVTAHPDDIEDGAVSERARRTTRGEQVAGCRPRGEAGIDGLHVAVTGAFTVRTVAGVADQADHRVAGLAALDVARDAGNRWNFVTWTPDTASRPPRRGGGPLRRPPARLRGATALGTVTSG